MISLHRAGHPGRPTGNQLLDRLPQAERDRLLPLSQTVAAAHGRELLPPEGPVSLVYFPISGVYSAVIAMEDGREIEAAAIGREGMVGLPVYLGLGGSLYRCIAQIPGAVIQLPAEAFRQAAAPGTALDALMRRYIGYRLRNASQPIACNALHSLQERTCRWLTTTHDRVDADEFPLTHEFLAEMLGVRRQTVTVIAGLLQRAGVLAYSRGIMRIIDREALEAGSCECYRAGVALYAGILR